MSGFLRFVATAFYLLLTIGVLAATWRAPNIEDADEPEGISIREGGNTNTFFGVWRTHSGGGLAGGK